ncbi:MAG: archaeosortase/exosortase family protein [Planctomycetota bacterium]|jgi:hypothetical protein
MTEPMAPPTARRVAVQVAILAAIALLMQRQELKPVLHSALRNSETAHLLAAPVLAGLLLWLRRRHLAAAITGGSAWGIAIVVAGLLVSAAATWPFSFALIRRLSFVVVVAGAVMAVGGGRLMWRSAPALLIVALAIPLGARIHGKATRGLEQIAMDVTPAMVEMMPGVIEARRDGHDLSFVSETGAGGIAAGEPHRWLALLYVTLTIGAFVAFARVRPCWQLAVLAVATIPIVLVCNQARLATWAVAVIHGGADPTSGTPRVAAGLVSIGLAWLLFALLGWMSGLPAAGARVAPPPAAGDSP